MSEGKADKDNVKKIEEDVFKTSGKIWNPDRMIFFPLRNVNGPNWPQKREKTQTESIIMDRICKFSKIKEVVSNSVSQGNSL